MALISRRLVTGLFVDDRGDPHVFWLIAFLPLMVVAVLVVVAGAVGRIVIGGRE